MRQKVTEELQSCKQAYIDNQILIYNCASPILSSWNGLVKLVCTISICDEEYFIISGHDDQLYLIERSLLTYE